MRNIVKKSTAFSIVEICVVFVILGVTILFTLHTVQEKQTEFYSRYSAAFDALLKAAHNVYKDTYCSDLLAGDEVGECRVLNSDGECIRRPFPESAGELSYRLRQYLNATADCDKDNTGRTACKVDDEGQPIESSEEPQLKCVEKTTITDTEGIDNFNNQFNKSTLQFSLSNGFSFYFSDMIKAQYTRCANGLKSANCSLSCSGPDDPYSSLPKCPISNADEEIRYFIVYVDLNGSGGPNSVANPSPNINADIVPFVLTEFGDVVPVGYPSVDTSYLTARLADPTNHFSVSNTFDIIRQQTYGNRHYKDIPYSLMPVYHNVIATTDDNIKFSQGTYNYTYAASNVSINNGIPCAINPYCANDSGYFSKFITGDTKAAALYSGCAPGTHNCYVQVDLNAARRH